MNANLISCRKESKMTQKEIANKVGISERMYQCLEYGTRLGSINTLTKLSKIFDKPIDYFVQK